MNKDRLSSIHKRPGSSLMNSKHFPADFQITEAESKVGSGAFVDKFEFINCNSCTDPYKNAVDWNRLADWRFLFPYLQSWRAN